MRRGCCRWTPPAPSSPAKGRPAMRHRLQSDVQFSWFGFALISSVLPAETAGWRRWDPNRRTTYQIGTAKETPDRGLKGAFPAIGERDRSVIEQNLAWREGFWRPGGTAQPLAQARGVCRFRRST